MSIMYYDTAIALDKLINAVFKSILNAIHTTPCISYNITKRLRKKGGTLFAVLIGVYTYHESV